MRAISRIAVLLLAPCLLAQTAADGIAAFHQGQYIKARDILAKIVSANPGDSAAQTFLALSRAALGSCDAAIADLRRQFASNPDANLRRFAGIGAVQCDLSRGHMSELWPVLEKLQQ